MWISNFLIITLIGSSYKFVSIKAKFLVSLYGMFQLILYNICGHGIAPFNSDCINDTWAELFLVSLPMYSWAYFCMTMATWIGFSTVISAMQIIKIVFELILSFQFDMRNAVTTFEKVSRIGTTNVINNCFITHGSYSCQPGFCFCYDVFDVITKC